MQFQCISNLVQQSFQVYNPDVLLFKFTINRKEDNYKLSVTAEYNI